MFFYQVVTSNLFLSMVLFLHNTGGDSMERNQIINGQYRIEKKIPSGPNNEIYIAHDICNERTIILKIFISSNVCASIHSRKESLLTLSSEFIPEVYEVGRLGEDGEMYIAEEFIEGNGLIQSLGNNSITFRQFFDIWGNLLEATDSMHRHQLVHGDIKPQNIFIKKKDGKDIGVLIDIDSAFVHEKGKFVGSLYYAAPEQILDGNYTPKTDIYSLGLVAYFLIERKPPFKPSRNGFRGRLDGTRKLALMHIHDADIRLDLELLLNEMVDVNPGNRPPIVNIKKRIHRIRSQVEKAGKLDQDIGFVQAQEETEKYCERSNGIEKKFITTVSHDVINREQLSALGTKEVNCISVGNERYREELIKEYKQLTMQATVTFRLWKITFGMGLILIVIAVLMILLEKYNEALLSIALEGLIYFAQKLFSMREDYYQKQNDEKLKHLRSLDYYEYAKDLLEKTDPALRDEKINRMLDSIFSQV